MSQLKHQVVDIKGYENLYRISHEGDVYSINSKKLLSPTTTGAGYKQVTLFKNGKRKSILIHHLVFDNFSDDKRDGRVIQVDHKDNNKLNNYIDNLQAVTNRVNSTKDKKAFVGTSYRKDNNKWTAEIYLNGKRNYLGQYDTQKEAHDAYLLVLKSHENG